MNSKKFKSLDLFAGFEQAGFQTVFANDFDAYCKATYDLNFNNILLKVCDVAKIKSEELPDFDILLAGFPCQPFSIAGYRRGFLDTGRGDLFFEILRIVKDKKPQVVFLENVKNLKSHDKGRTFKIISDALSDLGYYIKVDVLNSAEYGNVPQNRERVYIVGFKSENAYNNFKFPEKVKLKKNIADVLEGKVDEKYYYNNSLMYEKLREGVKSINTIYQWRRTYVRENKSGVCPTLTANMGMGGHNVPLIKDKKGIRKLTPRECARFQGFPDSFRFPTNLADTKLYKQIGNSVTVTVIKSVADQIMKAIES